ncbi:MAG: PepSY domain-containing protein, partial [Bacteroidia bacterium]|nr:PepSY domain-containing protein [Bacteroidia bacterium]
MRTCLTLVFLFLFSFSGFAGNHVHHNDDPLLKTFIENNQRIPDEVYQAELRNQPAWQNFMQNHGTWFVTFNEENAKPHRAYGKPIAMGNNGNEVNTAIDFINNHLKDFNVPVKELQLMSSIEGTKYHFVHFNQYHKNLEVLFTRSTIKLTFNNEVVMYSLDVYDDIDVNIVPSLNLVAAQASASSGVANVTAIEKGDLKILPIPSYRSNDYRLVYEIMVKNEDAHGIPAHYYTLVDAHTGDVLYRHNEVAHCSGGTDITCSGTVLEDGFFNPASVQGLPYLKMVENGNTHFADDAGDFNISITGNVNGNFTLEGMYCEVFTSNVMPSMSQTIMNGQQNNVSFDNDATDRELNAYR